MPEVGDVADIVAAAIPVGGAAALVDFTMVDSPSADSPLALMFA